MGGRVPLGYEVRDRKLEVVEAEAETVRHIFHRYLEVGSVADLRDALAAAGIGGKRRIDSDGKEIAGKPLDRGALYHLLQNRLYRGEVSHEGKVHPGQHEAIVDQDLWNRVQAVLTENRVDRKLRAEAASPSLLAGLVRDEGGVPMTPTHANKKGRRYRYYVSNDPIVGRRKDDGVADDEETVRGAARRIPTAELEAVVEQRIRSFLGDEAGLYPLIAPLCSDPSRVRAVISDLGTRSARWSAADRSTRIALIDRLVDQVTVLADRVDIEVRPEALTDLGTLRAQAFQAVS